MITLSRSVVGVWKNVCAALIVLCTLVKAGGIRADENRQITALLPGGAAMAFIWMDPGTFLMGMSQSQEDTLVFGPGGESGSSGTTVSFPDERPLHEVTISQGFYLAKYEVTQEQWEQTTGTRPWEGLRSTQTCPQCAASGMSWLEAQAMIELLNRAEGQTTYRLPTEAEWEYACRARTATPWHFYSYESEPESLYQYGWVQDNAEHAGEAYAHRVGLKLPNPWGLHDMYGNVSEWCQDWYSTDYYEHSPSRDPVGPTSGAHRVLRGGNFFEPSLFSRSATRDHYWPDGRGPSRGVRLVAQLRPLHATSVKPETWGELKSGR